MNRFFTISSVFRLALLWLWTNPAVATGSLQIVLEDADNLPVADAVVELVPRSAGKPDSGTFPEQQMIQINRTFVPFVMAIPAGTKVQFPNRDRTRHHVYSFSPAKTFELKLYVGIPRQPLTFDQPGIVALGCNIHDYMQAYIYVGSSNFLAVTDVSGRVTLAPPAGMDYDIRVWHPWQKTEPLVIDSPVLVGDSKLRLQLDVVRQAKPSAPPAGFGNLQQIRG